MFLLGSERLTSAAFPEAVEVDRAQTQVDEDQKGLSREGSTQKTEKLRTFMTKKAAQVAVEAYWLVQKKDLSMVLALN